MTNRTLISVLLLTACGGIVNYSPDGGEGGAGALGGGAGASDPTTNPQTMDVTTGPQATCDVFCAQFFDCFGGASECADLCESIYAPGCEGQADAYLQCLIDVNPQNCGFDEGVCPSEEVAYAQCVNQSACATDECAQSSDGSCECSGECNGVKVEQFCAPSFTGEGAGTSVGSSTGGEPPPNELFCNCFVNGDYVADCFADAFSCSLE